jgi:hypothetical protein
LNTAGAKTNQVALLEILLSAEIQTLPEQLSAVHPSSKEQYNSAGGASFCCAVRRSHLSRKWRSGEELLRSISTTLEQIALLEILLLEKI